MGRTLLLSFLALPLIEIAGFIQVGRLIGLLPTLAWVVISALAGMLVIKTQGLQLAAQIRATMGSGQLPARSVGDAMLVFLAGVLLLIPGFFSDIVALLLLLPPVRGLIYDALRARMTVVATASAGSRFSEEPRQVRHTTIELDSDDYRAN